MWPLASLPSDHSDRAKVQITELYLRIFDGYIGGIIEKFLGPTAKNAFLRLLMAIGFAITNFIDGPHSKDVKIHDEKIEGIRVRCYTPTNIASDGAFVYFHGGGWCTMKPEYYESAVVWFSEQLGIRSFSVDYRLAPEHPFPAAFDDCLTVVEYLHENCERYGIDNSKIVIAGDSAGGQLTAVIAQKLKHLVRCQVIIYPATTYFAFNLPSYKEYYRKFNHMAVLSPDSVARWTLMYMGLPAHKRNIEKILNGQHISDEVRSTSQYQKYLAWDQIREMYPRENYQNNECQEDPEIAEKFKQALNPAISPLFGVSKDLPPAIIITCGYDVLRDEGIIYYREMEEKGVDVTWKHYPTGFHGIVNLRGSQLREKIFTDIADFIKLQFT